MSPRQPCAADTIDVALELCGFRFSGRRIGGASGNLGIVFVGGAFQTMDSWRSFADHFRRVATVGLVDLPGSGTADVLPARYGLDFLAQALAVALDGMGMGKVCLVAASYGSPVAYRFAQLHSERVERLVLAGVMKQIPANVWAKTERTLTLLREGRMADFAGAVIDGLLCRAPDKRVHRGSVALRLLRGQLERMGGSDRERYEENTLRLLRHDPLDLSRRLAIPTLVFTGEHDVYTRPEDCREIAASCDPGWFTTVRDADHLFHIERFETTRDLVDRFFRTGGIAGVTGIHAPERLGRAVGGIEEPDEPAAGRPYPAEVAFMG